MHYQVCFHAIYYYYQILLGMFRCAIRYDIVSLHYLGMFPYNVRYVSMGNIPSSAWEHTYYNHGNIPNSAQHQITMFPCTIRYNYDNVCFHALLGIIVILCMFACTIRYIFMKYQVCFHTVRCVTIRHVSIETYLIHYRNNHVDVTNYYEESRSNLNC